ncbi:hypothetical protein ACKX2L_06025 [Lachnospiraceae bacterium YH-ros2228]
MAEFTVIVNGVKKAEFPNIFGVTKCVRGLIKDQKVDAHSITVLDSEGHETLQCLVDGCQRAFDIEEAKIGGKVVTGLRASDGRPVTGFVLGTEPVLYILPEEEVRKVCDSDEPQMEIKLTAEMILVNSIMV